MKYVILCAMAFVFIACDSNSDKAKQTTPTETKTIDTIKSTEKVNPVTEQLYACSMHPEITGKKDETCPKCGMKLTVLVKNTENRK